MEARDIIASSAPAVGALLVGRHTSNADRLARVVAVSPDGLHTCLWHGYRMAWNRTASVSKNYRPADNDRGDVLAVPADKAIPALTVAPTERPAMASVEPLPVPAVEPAPAPVAEPVAVVVEAEETEPVSDAAPIEAPAGRMLALFAGVPVAIASDADPLVRDLTLAERLGYDRPRDIRKLIKRCQETGLLRDVVERDTVARSSMPRGGTREIETTEFWLTEAQTLAVIMRSDTPNAVAVQHEMIQVYMLARRGMLPGQAPAPVAAPVDYAAIGAAVAAAVSSTVGPMLEATLARLAPPPPAPPAPPPPSNVKDMERERAFRSVWAEQAPVYRDLLRRFAETHLERADLSREDQRKDALTSGEIHKRFAAWLAPQRITAPFPRVTYKLINEISTLYAGRTDDPDRQVRAFRPVRQMVLSGGDR